VTNTISLKEFVGNKKSVFFLKKQLKYKLISKVVNSFGTEVYLFKKRELCNPIDSIKFYFPLKNQILKEETNVVCQYCKLGTEIHHPVQFLEKDIHIQATCSFCHRYLRYVKHAERQL
jgi:hypothetical protein